MEELGPIIGSGRLADVHAYGTHAIKLYHVGRGKAEAFIEAAILALVEGHGLPAPQVHAAGRYGDRWGLVVDRIDGPTLGQLVLHDPGWLGEGLEEMARLQLLLHGTVETRLRPLKARLIANIGRVAALGDARRQRLIAQVVALPDGDRICHGDFHPFNIIGAPGRTTIIDWVDATCGPPAADACRSYLLLKQGAPDIADAYLERYVARSELAVADIVAWMPCVAAARLAEGIEDEERSLLELARAI